LERQSVIFDLDGTLVETEQIWRDVRRRFVTTHGGRWNACAAAAMIGMRTSEWADYIHADLGVALPAGEIAKAVVAGVIARLQTVPVLRGAPGALERLAGAFRLGLATSASLPVAAAVLEKTGWRRFFEVVVSADDVQRGKPAPDVYLRTLELMGADPNRTAAVEDSANGIRSAHAAGLAVIAIPNREFPPDAGSLALASKVLPNLDALDVALVREVAS
jgi:beta-phosphoglucomutase-like phosphatase (HAD superfamily)